MTSFVFFCTLRKVEWKPGGLGFFSPSKRELGLIVTFAKGITVGKLGGISLPL